MNASRSYSSLTAHYAPGEQRPIAAYAGLVTAYGALTTAALLALRASGRRLPERLSPADLVVAGIATHKVSRIIAKDKVTSFARAPFTRFQKKSGQGEVEEEAYGEGARFAIGELLVCPYCLGQWVATAYVLGLIGAPRFTRLLGSVFVAYTISDFLQLGYLAAEGAS